MLRKAQLGSQRFETWKQKAKRLKTEVYALYLACKDPRVPWYARALAVVVVGYALSPIDLIPDPIPVLGYLDDLILLPLGILLVIKMIPQEVLADCRQQALKMQNKSKPKNRIAGAIIIIIWIGTVLLIAFYLNRWLGNNGY